MNQYNFDEIIDRTGTDCLKWDDNGSPDIHPMWVADMDFAVAPEIQAAMERRLAPPCVRLHLPRRRPALRHHLLGGTPLSLEH